MVFDNGQARSTEAKSAGYMRQAGAPCAKHSHSAGSRAAWSSTRKAWQCGWRPAGGLGRSTAGAPVSRKRRLAIKLHDVRLFSEQLFDCRDQVLVMTEKQHLRLLR